LQRKGAERVSIEETRRAGTLLGRDVLEARLREQEGGLSLSRLFSAYLPATTMMRLCILVLLAIVDVACFGVRPTITRRALPRLCAEEGEDSIEKAMAAARRNEKQNTSPGAGLDAFAAADAAYADLINTSMDQRGLESDDLDLAKLERGGKMWESGALNKTRKGGLLGDLGNTLTALFGGAQIEKNKFGET